MILLRIVSKNEAMLDEVAGFLLKENLAIDVNMKRHLERIELVDGFITSVRLFLLTAKTRSLLFETIQLKLREKYGNNLPEIYALPIVNMDWKSADDIHSKVRQEIPSEDV